MIKETLQSGLGNEVLTVHSFTRMKGNKNNSQSY